MLEYDFTSRDREPGHVVFALTIDKKRMTERVVIGWVDEAKRRLESKEGSVYYDDTRPLGSLLFGFESDGNGEWNKNGMILRESYAKTFPIGQSRWKTAAPVAEFLSQKYKSGEPSAMFAAICTWEDYLRLYNKRQASDTLTSRLFMMYKPFAVYADYKPWQEEAAAALSVALRDGESGVEVWYPINKRPFETMVITSSFLPIIFYYMHKIKEWGYVFQQCKVCGVHFLARSRHYELCSDKCRKVQAVTAKREYDERVKGDKLEQLDEAAYYYWYNRLRKLRKGKAANPSKAAAFKIEFDVFRKEAVRLKKLVRCKEMSLADFASWLAQRQNEADILME